MKHFLTLLCSLLALTIPSAFAQTGGGKISLSPESATISVGGKVTLKATYTGKKTLDWQSYNTECLSIQTSGDGLSCTVTGLAEGAGTIYVQEKGANSWESSAAYAYITVEGKALTDADLPFVATTISGGKLAADTHWYILTLRGKYLYVDEEGQLRCEVGEPIYDGKTPMTHYLWAFVGNLQNGFQIYNYDTDATKLVGVEELTELVDPDDKTYLNGAYARMYPKGQLDVAYSTFRASTNADGLTFTLRDEKYAGLNDFNSSGIVRLWDSASNLKDGGACFRFSEADPIAYGAEAATDAIHETSVTLNKYSLDMSTGEQFTLVATVAPANATYAKRLTWTSTNPAVASVGTDGTVSAKSAGTTTITVTTFYGLTASCNVKVTLNTSTQGLMINEIQAANVDQYLDPSYNYGGWVELYNGSSSAISLKGLFLTDTTDDLTQWPLASLDYNYSHYTRYYTYAPHEQTTTNVPARGYCLIWFDHNDWRYPMMCPFKLDCDGGALYVTDGNAVIAQAEYPASISRASYARTTDGGSTWGWTSAPTPKASNAGTTYATQRLEAPVIEASTSIFRSGSVSARVTYPAGATLRYTTDGSTPSATNGQTSTNGSFTFRNSTVLRVCAVKQGMLTSPVVTRSFLNSDADQEYIPTMSLVTEEGNLYDDEYGIMTMGSNGRPGLGQSNKCNWNQDWDRPANIELIGTDGSELFNQETNVAICGGWSRAHEPHSFKVKGKKQYEHINYLPYAFFPNKPYIKNKTLQMRNGGNDNSARFKDAGLQSVVLESGVNVDGQSYEPVHLYRNGEYIGIINMREPNNRDYVYANFGYDDNEVDQFEMDCDSAYVQSSGDREAFERWYELAQRSADPQAYEELKQICDVEEFINYMAVQCFLALADYGYNNVKGYRPRVEHGKFRMVLYDLDSASSSGTAFGLASPVKTRSWNNQYEGTNGQKGTSVSGHIEFQEIFGNLMYNCDEFRKQFVDQFAILCGSVFEPENAAAIIDRTLAKVKDAADQESWRYASALSPASTANELKSSFFTANRIASALATMAGSQGYAAACKGSKQTLLLTQNEANGRLLLNDLTIPTGKFNGRFFSPAVLRAEAPAGYKFVGWKDMGSAAGTTEGTEKTLVSNGAKWYYYDKGSLDGENWTAKNYSDYDWSEGAAPLGYSNNVDIKTQTAKGVLTTYFRHNANLTTEITAAQLNYRVDDGFAVYVNGKEAGRYNLAAGAKFDQTASSYAGNYFDGTLDLDPTLFQQGTNTIAVEVHNSSAGSSDIVWDCSLTITEKASTTNPEPDPEVEYVSTEAEYELPATGNFKLQAVYAPLTTAEVATTDHHAVKINEVSAANSVYVNDYFKKDDWVELYNTTSQPIDLTGYYLSDDINNPTKYQIPASQIKDANVIPAHGHRIVWCSKRERTGKEIHASFKLGNTDGCAVTLTAPDQSWTDVLAYPAMNGDETCGVFPDGSTQAYMMQMPTISKSNTLTMYADAYDKKELLNRGTTGIEKVISHSNELGINLLGQQLVVTNEYFLPTTVEVFTLDGRCVLTQALDMSEGRSSVSVADLPAGTYVARATDADEVSVSTKFSK